MLLHQVPPPLRSSEPAADIQGFFRAVGEALDLHVKTAGAPDGITPVYVHSFPKERLSQPSVPGQPGKPFDVITHHVLDGGMSATSNDGSRVPRAPVLREKKPHPDKTGYALCTTGWWEDATVVFTIWSNSNENADELTVWFHRFMMRYAYFYGFFQARGIQQFRFVKRLEDDTEDREGQELYRRYLAYSLRLEYLDTFEERQLTDVTLNVTAGRDTDSKELSAE
jgi:hypothetical protein